METLSREMGALGYEMETLGCEMETLSREMGALGCASLLEIGNFKVKGY